jgi:chemotaxis protein methyltransferase CheR
MAITACEAFGTLKPPVRIIATDVDTQVLATAGRGVYNIDRVASLDPDLRRRYFQRGSGPNEGQCRVLPALRELIEFRPLNLLAPRYDVGGPFDALFCRNVMIYFDKPTQRAILGRLVQHLADDGLLYTGHSENYLHAADLIQPCGAPVPPCGEGRRMNASLRTDDVMRYQDARFQTLPPSCCRPSTWWSMTPPR